MKTLVSRARVILSAAGGGCEMKCNPSALAQYRRKTAVAVSAADDILLAADTAVELGPPACFSLHTVLWTAEPEIIRDGSITLVGPDLPACRGEKRDYGQILLLGLAKPPGMGFFRLESIQFFTGRLPGVMARAVPGRLWLRISYQALAAGLDFLLFGTALAEAYRQEAQGVLAVESIFFTSGRDLMERFSALAAEAEIYLGRHQKISLGRSGEYECEELNCAACEEKPVCDQIRKAAIIRRKLRNR